MKIELYNDDFKNELDLTQYNTIQVRHKALLDELRSKV